MLKRAVEAERAERDQDADCARIDAAIGLSEQDIAALEDRQLDPDEMRKQWSAIRDRTILAIRDVVHNVVKRAIEAKATEDRMIQKFVREESNGRVMGEFSVALKEVPTRELVDYLRSHGRKKVLFGSNHPAWPAHVCLAELSSLGLDVDNEALFLRENAERVFGL